MFGLTLRRKKSERLSFLVIYIKKTFQTRITQP